MHKVGLLLILVTCIYCCGQENVVFSENLLVAPQTEKTVSVSGNLKTAKGVFLEIQCILQSETPAPAAPVLFLSINGAALDESHWPANVKNKFYTYINQSFQGTPNMDIFQNGNWTVQILPDLGTLFDKKDIYYSPELTEQNNTYKFDITAFASDSQNSVLIKNNSSSLPFLIKLKILTSDEKTVLEESKQRSTKVFAVKDPLFEQLISNEKPKYWGNSALLWSHLLGTATMYPYARQYAVPYVWEDQFKELAELGLTPLLNWSQIDVNGTGVENPPWPTQKYIQKYGFKVLLSPYWNKGRYIGIKHKAYYGRYGIRPYVFDPEVKQVLLDDIKDGLLKNGGSKVYWGVYSEGEIREIGLEFTIYLWDQQRDTYPYIRQVYDEVRDKYGFGKYGIPSPNDTDPFKWIAVQRWCDAQMVDWQKSVYEQVKSIDANIIVVGTDSGGRNRQWDFPGESKYIDIVTHQLQPDSNPYNCTLGFMTKVLVDTMGKPIWPIPHIENYFGCFTPEEVTEMISQTFRSGATGFFWYLTDSKNASSLFGWTPSCKYGAPSQWTAIMDISAAAREMNKLKFPQPDCALFYSIDAHSATPNPKAESDCPYSREPEYAFTFLGPYARSWFKIVCDNQIAADKPDLSDYKALYIAYAPYQRSNVIEQIKSYAKQGGTIVCCDPKAFSFDIDGADLTAVRKELFGVCLANSNNNNKIRPVDSLGADVNSWLSVQNAYTIEPITNTETLASYPDGKPAIVMNKYGKGRIIFFAFNPFTQINLADTNWQNFFKSFQKYLGLKTDHDIWRFKFPVKEYIEPQIDGGCLTNNYMRWELFKAVFLNNVDTRGSYNYSIPPDFKPDVQNTGNIGFEQGRLTDRRKAPTSKTATSEAAANEWIVSWQDERPVDLTFDFVKSFEINKVRIIYSEQLPQIEILISDDGQKWQSVARSDKKTSTKDICEYVQDGFTQLGRYVKIKFDARDPGCKMELSEVEIWSK